MEGVRLQPRHRWRGHDRRRQAQSIYPRNGDAACRRPCRHLAGPLLARLADKTPDNANPYFEKAFRLDIGHRTGGQDRTFLKKMSVSVRTTPPDIVRTHVRFVRSCPAHV